MEHISNVQRDQPIQTTYGELVDAFTEWDRRWREDPEGFDSDVKRILRGQTITEYGQSATLTLMEMLGHVGTGREAVDNIPKRLEGLAPVLWYEVTDQTGTIGMHTPKEKGGHLNLSIEQQQYAVKIVAHLEDHTELVLKDRNNPIR